MKISILGFVFGVAVLALIAPGSWSSAVQSEVENSNSHEFKPIESGLLHQLVLIIDYINGHILNVAARNELSNIAFCPFSLDILLAMLYFGANPITHQRINASLYIPTDNLVGKDVLHQLIHNMTKLPKDKFKIETNIFNREGLHLNLDFLGIVINDLEANQPNPVNFSNTEEVALKLNKWTSDSTGGFVHNLFKTNDLEKSSLVLANIGDLDIEFRNAFVTSFRPGVFRTKENSEKQVDFLIQADSYKHGNSDNLDVSWIEIPLKNEALSLVYFKPKNATIFDSFEKELGQFDIFQYPYNVTLLDIKIPAVNITTFLNLKPTIIESGLDGLLQDLNYIYDNTSLSIDQISQKASMQISQKGVKVIYGTQITSQAAAANETLNQSSNQTGRPNQSPVNSAPITEKQAQFIVDVPHYVVIYQTSSGAPIFYARVVDVPSSNINTGSFIDERK